MDTASEHNGHSTARTRTAVQLLLKRRSGAAGKANKATTADA